jgi:hypothetical protein
MTPFTVRTSDGWDYFATAVKSIFNDDIRMECPGLNITVIFHWHGLLTIEYRYKSVSMQNKFVYENKKDAVAAFRIIWHFIEDKGFDNIGHMFQNKTKSARATAYIAEPTTIKPTTIPDA